MPKDTFYRRHIWERFPSAGLNTSSTELILEGLILRRLSIYYGPSQERYFDTATRRKVGVGRHGDLLVVIPYDKEENVLIPVTIHATKRQQINFRLKNGRFINE